MGLSDYQWQYTNPRGATILFGDGADYAVTAVDGLEGESGARIGDHELPRGHGSVPGLHLAAARQALVSIEWTGITGALFAALTDVVGIEITDLGSLNWKLPGRDEVMIHCRPTAVPRSMDTNTQFLSRSNLLFVASDPRIYSAEEHNAVVPLYAPTGGGLDYPLDYPLDFAAGVPVEVAVTNLGNSDAYPMLRFYGPASGTVTNATMKNQTTGGQVSITTSVAAGQILTFDGSASVTGSGDLVVGIDGSSRYGSWDQPRAPLALPPGESVLRFTTTGTATAVSAVVSWRDTSLS